jgi:hypothetical protein
VSYARETLRWRSNAYLCPGGFALVASWWPDEETWTARREAGECVVDWPPADELDALCAKPGGMHLRMMRQWHPTAPKVGSTAPTPAARPDERERRAEALCIIALTFEDAFGKKKAESIARHAAKRRGAEQLEGLPLAALEGMAEWCARTPGEQVAEELGAKYSEWLASNRTLRGLVADIVRVEGGLLGADEAADLPEDAHEGLKIELGVGSYHELTEGQFAQLERDLKREGIGKLLDAAEAARAARGESVDEDTRQGALL